jgi:hypothetical protein
LTVAAGDGAVSFGGDLTVAGGDALTSGIGGAAILHGGQGYNTGGDARVYGGTGSVAGDGNVILAHDGTKAVGNVGIGTTTPQADSKLNVKGGHVAISQTTAPTLSACGTGPAVLGSDNAGKVTMAADTGASCVLTFHAAWTNAPACMTNDESSTAIVAVTNSTTATAMTIRATSLTSKAVSYICMGY